MILVEFFFCFLFFVMYTKFQSLVRDVIVFYFHSDFVQKLLQKYLVKFYVVIERFKKYNIIESQPSLIKLLLKNISIPQEYLPCSCSNYSSAFTHIVPFIAPQYADLMRLCFSLKPCNFSSKFKHRQIVCLQTSRVVVRNYSYFSYSRFSFFVSLPNLESIYTT